MSDIFIDVAKQFSYSPGARYKSEGPKSGEEFREEFLIPALENDKIHINLDGGYGYGCSFLEEAFGGLIRKYPYRSTIDMFDIRSSEEPHLKDEIKGFMEDALEDADTFRRYCDRNSFILNESDVIKFVGLEKSIRSIQKDEADIGSRHLRELWIKWKIWKEL